MISVSRTKRNTLAVHHVSLLPQKMRLSDYLTGKFVVIASRKATKKAIKKGRIVVDGELGLTSTWVRGGENIQLLAEDFKQPKVPFNRDLSIAYEDEHIAVIDKPSGIPVNGNHGLTLEHLVGVDRTTISLSGQLPKPLSAHRLDRATSGLVIFAKTYPALVKLNDMFKRREIEKFYLALVMGKITSKGLIDSKVNGKSAITRYIPLRYAPSIKYGGVSLVLLQPITGRTHQLRKHLATIGHSILGDQLYGTPTTQKARGGLFLRAIKLKFHHPVSGKLLDIRVDHGKRIQSFFKAEDIMNLI